MNAARESAEKDPGNDVAYFNFNQVSTALSVGMKTGFKLYKFEDIHRFQPDYECNLNEEVCLIERHYLSSLVVFVKLSCPRKLTFYNFSNQAEIAVKHFANTILSIKLNRKIFVVCLEDSLHIFDIMMMNLTHVITNTPSNPKGICALTASNGDSLLAYPGSSQVGDIQIFDATKLLAKNAIPAHNSPIAFIAFNDDGTKIASASEKGTVIRVFSVSDGSTLFEFRRGVRRCATIYSLSFSAGSEYLCASSNTETVHVFKLSKEEEHPVDIVDENEGWMATMGKMLTYSAKYLPSQMSDVLTQERSFATMYLPFSGMRNISCITKIKKVSYVLVASSDGILHIYQLKPEGGECPLIKQYRLDSNSSCVYLPDMKKDVLEDHRDSVPPSRCRNTSGDVSNLRQSTERSDSDGEISDSCPPLSFSVT